MPSEPSEPSEPSQPTTLTFHALLTAGLLLSLTACIAGDSGEMPDGGGGDGDGDARAVDAAVPRDGGGDGDGDGDGGGPVDGGADAGDGGGEPVTLQAYCQGVAEWYYPFLQRCYGQQGYPDAERDGRVAGWRERCLQSQRGLDGGRLRFDGVAAAACLAAREALPCFAPVEAVAACRDTFVPTPALGEDCYPDEFLFFGVDATGCGEGYCARGDGCPGSCTAYLPRGATCDSGRCAPGDHCDGVCKASAGLGEACGALPCAAGLLCEGMGGSMDGEARCVTPGAEGDACGDGAPCGSPGVCIEGSCVTRVASGQACALGLNCPAGERCTQRPGEAGYTCQAPGGQGAGCTGDRDCDGASYHCDPVGQLCVAYPARGAACAEGRCGPADYCRYDDVAPDGACRARGGQGADCLQYGAVPSSAGCDDGLYCSIDGACQPPGQAGQPCAAFEEDSCAEGLFCDRASRTCTLPAAHGGQCNPAWGRSCGEGLGCACGTVDGCTSYTRESTPTDTCEPLLAEGAACARYQECESASCDAQASGPARCGPVAGAEPLCLGPG